MKIVFFGTPLFAATVLEYLLHNHVEVVAVVTKPDRPKGRSGQPQPPPVKLIAQKHHLPLYQPLKASSPDFAKELATFNADLFIVVAYSEILRENILQLPRLDCINVHASLLPKYRGAAPIQRCIMAGEKQSGVTIMSMVKELDAGDMIAVSTIHIDDQMTAGDLSIALSEIGAEALLKVIHAYTHGTVKKTPQDHTKATYASKLNSEDGKINWARPAYEVHNHIRGVTPSPGAWCWIDIRGEKKRLSIKKSTLQTYSGSPGKRILEASGWTVGCLEGAISIIEVQLEGKKALSAAEFVRGYPDQPLFLY